MLKIKPVPEYQSHGNLRELYKDIKNTLGLISVPVIFQYLGAFPEYLDYIWSQAKTNLHDKSFTSASSQVEKFSQDAIDIIYRPTPLAQLFVEKIGDSGESETVRDFAAKNRTVNSKLYLFSLSIRESVKGKFLGLKLFGEKLSHEEKSRFTDFEDGFVGKTDQTPEPGEENRIRDADMFLARKESSLTTSTIHVFLGVIEKEMNRLAKREDYLQARVALEKLALNALLFTNHPFDSSLSAIISRASQYPNFPELIYLVSELYPTQAPFKLLAASLMNTILKISG